ncbi:hemerythrin domain-containing protein [Flavobacteriaceae bacterium F08102]|nr:hemerythrin domain-containing protein [Flavobacteriaceae bacterium F08102]
MKTNPIKRNIALQGLSRDHHHGLLLAWKIRKGFSKNISNDRIKRYVDWFFINYLLPHFKLEETYIFPILGDAHESVMRAQAAHRRLVRLFQKTSNLTSVLTHIEEELEQHIRFEERQLFNEIQEVASPEQLSKIAEIHEDLSFVENTEDTFWI